MASMLLGFVAQLFDWVSLNQLQNTQKSQKWHKEAIKILKCDDMETAWSYQVTIDCIFVSDWSKRCTWCAFLRLIAEHNITKSTHSQIDLDTQLQTNLWNQLLLSGARGRSGVKQGGSISWSHQFLSLIFENQELRDVVYN